MTKYERLNQAKADAATRTANINNLKSELQDAEDLLQAVPILGEEYSIVTKEINKLKAMIAQEEGQLNEANRIISIGGENADFELKGLK